MKNKIIKITILISMLVIAIISLTGCGNLDMIDMNYTFNRAIVTLNDGTRMELEIQQWTTYEGEQIQIQAKDGKTYLLSSFNTILIKD